MASDIGLQIKVLFFASAREAAKGTTETTLVLDSGADTAILRNVLAEKYPKLAPLVLDEDNITFALNEEYVTGVQKLKSGDVVALIPPISGG